MTLANQIETLSESVSELAHQIDIQNHDELVDALRDNTSTMERLIEMIEAGMGVKTINTYVAPFA